MKYLVIKRHVKGFLRGMDTKEVTAVKFTVGKNYGDYICIKCEEVKENEVR